MEIYRRKMKAEVILLSESDIELNEDEIITILFEIEQTINSLAPHKKTIGNNTIQSNIRLHLKELI